MRLADVFNDHMVFQRNQKICVFGYGTGIGSIEFLGETYNFTSKNNKFCVYLPPHSEGGPYEMKVTLNGTSQVIRDIMIGEVYIAAGQSNMEFILGKTCNIEYTTNNNIRFFTEPNDADINCIHSSNPAKWIVCNNKEVDIFSAIGYYFAVDLQKHINVPIGIVSCSKGASRIDAWTSPEYVESEEYQQMLKTKHNDYEIFKFNQNSWLYTNKLLKIVPYANSGVLWYQGESNRCYHEGVHYKELLEILVKNWREIWNYNLPFYCVQLMPFDEEPTNADWAIIRSQQELASKTIPNFHLITLFDTNEAKNIHPLNKKDVSYALSNAVRSIQFNEDLEYCGPILDDYAIYNNYILLNFSHAEGLHFKGANILDTYIYFGDTKVSPKMYSIEGNKIKLFWESKSNSKPSKICMGYTNAPTHTLYNSSNYLASPFCLTFSNT